MKIEETDNIVVMGMRKSGKTYLAQKLSDKFPRQIICDPMNEYYGDVYCYSLKTLREKMAVIYENRPASYRIVFRFDPEEEDQIAIFNAVCKLVYFLGDCCFVADELHDFCTPHNLPHWFKNILMKGRHRGLAGVFTTQRPSHLNKAVLSQAAHLFIGQLHEANDIKHVSNFISVPKETLIKLGRRKFLYFSPFADGKVIYSTEK